MLNISKRSALRAMQSVFIIRRKSAYHHRGIMYLTGFALARTVVSRPFGTRKKAPKRVLFLVRLPGLEPRTSASEAEILSS